MTKIVYSEKYYVDIGSHVFPTLKYRLVKKKLSENFTSGNKIFFVEPKPAADTDILRVHTKRYFDKLKYGKLSVEEVLTLELPYSRELVESSILCCGGTISATQLALEKGFGIHLGGGFHHAFPDHGEGFCVLNDIAVAVKKILEKKQAERALVIDCDLHQGNGTAYIFQDDEDVYTFSIHQENNYPFYKPKSDMDIGLRDRTRDSEYLIRLEDNIPKIISDFKPRFIIYVAGADPYAEDQIGNLALTIDGLQKRDFFVYSQAKNYGVPIATVLAGGYAANQDDTVQIHYNTINTALEVFDAC